MPNKHFILNEKNKKNLEKYENKFHSKRQWIMTKALEEFFEEVGL